MIACFVEENHNSWDPFLHEFSFALRTSVNEKTGKTPAELFLGRKIVTPFRKLINVTEGTGYVGGNIEKLFDDARQNMRKQHKTWEKYYNQKWREVNIKVNDLVLVETHFISAVSRRVVGKFMPKFEGPYRVLEVRNNNLIIWKRKEGSQLILTKCGCTTQDSPTQLVLIVMMRHYMKERGLVMGRVDHTRENPEVLGDLRVMRVSVVNQLRGLPDWRI
ncbi:uncharacterized protein TNCV_3768891 [Trichonephila clavipes]|nr:uncharacterized protein TNCV_3768891 [Trichonephila clavipes]